MDADLEAFHNDPERQRWTEGLVGVARNLQATKVIDIGCGAGHDLRALRADNPELELTGVEPNERFRLRLLAEYFHCVAHVALARIEDADLISCFDVLEHVVDPESFLGDIAERARLGAVLIETCATFDVGTPLHLKENRGWRTGRVLERHGWDKIDEQGRVRVWQRMALENHVSTSLIVTTFRSISMPTHRSVMKLLLKDAANARGWREADGSEAGLLRARNIAASRFWADTADDVFLMVDDDIEFKPEDAEHLVDLCRNGHDVVAAAYPVRDGGHLALRVLDDATTELAFGSGQPPMQVRHMSTGFFAVHRRVLDAMIPTLPLCHANMPWAFWPMFDFEVIEDETAGGFNHLSEDYWFCERAQQLGFKVWLDPTIHLKHYGLVPISVMNMASVAETVKHA